MPGPLSAARIAEAWSRRAALRVAITALLVFAYVWLSGPTPPVQADSIQDYSIARLCAEGQGCQGHDTSVQGLVQGRLLLLVLATMMGLGLTPTQQLLVFIALTTAAVVILAELARALAGARAGLAAAGLGAWALPAAAGHPVLWNPTLASLPVALMTVSVAQLARSQTPGRWALAFVVGLVGAYHSHIVHLLAWPLASALVGAATEDRRARATVVAGPIVGLLAFDREGLLANAATLLAAPIGRLACASILAGALAGAAFRPRWQGLDEARRSLAALAGYGLTIFAVVALAALLGGLPFAGRYFAAAAPALVVLVVVSAERVDARTGLVVSALVALFISHRLGARLSEDRTWSYACARPRASTWRRAPGPAPTRRSRSAPRSEPRACW